MTYSDDPHADFDRWDAERERWLLVLPKCAQCDQHIQDDDLYDFDGDLVCPDCVSDWVDEHYKKRTSDYILDLS